MTAPSPGIRHQPHDAVSISLPAAYYLRYFMRSRQWSVVRGRCVPAARPVSRPRIIFPLDQAIYIAVFNSRESEYSHGKSDNYIWSILFLLYFVCTYTSNKLTNNISILFYSDGKKTFAYMM